MTTLKVELASLPDRDEVVAEIWSENLQLAEVYQATDGVLKIIFFGNEFQCDYRELLNSLKQAETKIQVSDTK